jgi:hypothetical protein
MEGVESLPLFAARPSPDEDLRRNRQIMTEIMTPLWGKDGAARIVSATIAAIQLQASEARWIVSDDPTYQREMSIRRPACCQARSAQVGSIARSK